MDKRIRTYQGISPKLGNRVFIDPLSVVLGDATLGDDVSIWPLVAVRADMHYIKIGDRTNVQDGSILHITHASNFNPDGFPLNIGDDVTIGHQVMLHGCTVGNRVLIGMSSILMDGAIVEDEVMLGAGSLVSPGKVLESGYLYIGRPAKKVRELTQQERDFFIYSAQNYVKLKDEHLAEAWCQ